MTSSTPQPYRILALLAFGLTVALPDIEAKPDFSSSEFVPTSRSVVAGDVARFTLKLRNQGDSPAQAVEVILQSPSTGHLLDVTGLEGSRIDPDAAIFGGKASLPVNAEREVQITVLTPRDTADHLLSLTVRLVHFDSMAETWLHAKVEIDSRPRSDGLLVGGVRVTTAGLICLGWLGATLLALALAAALTPKSRSGRFFGPPAGALAIMIALGFWLVFAVMAWHDYQVLFHWKQTTGTIIGRRIAVHTVASNHRLSSGATSQTRQSDVAKPEFAVRYPVAGREWLSTGYDTGSSLRVGGGKAQLEKEFQQWTVGAQVPCWYDPADPAAIVLKRGFGGAYLFALLPLFPFWIGWRILRSRPAA